MQILVWLMAISFLALPAAADPTAPLTLVPPDDELGPLAT
jgi:hypothetical protein